jgi:non-specific serine/threonine protein kinase
MRLWEDALALDRQQGNYLGVAFILVNMGFAEIALGNYERSAVLLEEVLTLGHKLNSREILASSLMCLGLTTALQGEPERANSMLKEGLAIDMVLEAKADLAEDLEALATTAGVLGQHARAARLWGAAEALREATGAIWGLSERLVYEPQLTAARSRLDQAAWEEAFAEGKTMGLERAVEYALSEERSATPASPVPDQASAVNQSPTLTAREGEVAAMVARGMSNRQIAQELFLSERTVETHVSKILRKLALASRAEIAAWATQQRLLAPSPD